MPNALVLHVNELPGVGLQRVARVELGEPIGAHDLPVGAARHDAAFQAGTRERSAGDGDDPAPPGRHDANFGGNAHLGADLDRFAKNVGADDRQKIQVHVDSVRTLEKQIQSLANGPMCTAWACSSLRC